MGGLSKKYMIYIWSECLLPQYTYWDSEHQTVETHIRDISAAGVPLMKK